MEALVICAITGAAAGLLAGLFGVGGGLIMVPALAFLLPEQGVPLAIIMQVAIATSLAVIAITSFSSTRAHHRRGGVRWDVFRGLAFGLALGALLGAFVAHQLKSRSLEIAVGSGAILVSLHMLWSAQKKVVFQSHAPAPGLAELLGVGASIGLISALVGIGGGSLTVPYLSARKLPMVQAVGTSAAGGIAIAWGGVLGFVMAGASLSSWGQFQLGYIHGKAFLGLAVMSVFTAPLGAKLAHRLPQQRLKQAFALLLALVGVAMLLRGG